MLQKELVEVGAPHLIGIGMLFAQLAEVQWPFFVAPLQEGSLFALKSGRIQFLAGPQEVEDLQHRGQKRLADVVARENRSLQGGHIEALPGQQGGSGRASGTGSDHENLSFCRDAQHGLWAP